ncbi:MAG: N-acetylmuramoyl-L-alanine amidase [Acidobacteriales bacterium]|nr:N-acetylmuramoyl-L-alanine amidase [Terriglobales bacterium]
MKKNFLRRLLILAGTVIAFASVLSNPLPAFAKRSVAQKKQIARTQFETAERLREALSGKSGKSRTKRDYTRVMDAYRKVYYTAPNSSKADASALAVGELMVEYGRAFNDEKSFRDAIGQYEFLRREYPGSKRRFEALFTEGEIYRQDLNDSKQAKQIFEEFLKRYPRHELADQAKDAINEMAAEAKGGKAATKKSAKNKVAEPEPKTAKATKQRKAEPADDEETAAAETTKSVAQPVSANTTPRHGKLPLVTSIRHWSTPDYTRIAIDLEEEVKYEAGRVPSPDRIFFDLHDTKLASELVGKTFEVGDGMLRKIRIAQFSQDLTRVVLEVDDVAEYSAFLLPNPYRLIIDIHGKQPAKTVLAKNTAPDVATEKPADVPPAKAEPTKPAKKAPDKPTTADTPADLGESPAKSDPAKRDSGKPVSSAVAKKIASDKADATKELTEEAAIDNKDITSKEVKATAAPTSSPTFEAVAPRKSGKSSKKDKAKDAEQVATVRTAEPTASGERSLIRALGLKIGRIVIDAGHGGHDTGTIGPHGLMEKDLVLDVALRLGKLLESKLGAEVVYTRDDDTFIPLETRTAIANKHQADLFISVHANSSRDASARGVETYYLNFTSNADALEVAARENAVSQKSVFELQDLVKKIALKEKIEESREFATDVQRALHAGLTTKSSAMRDRGVKKAPFVVLIGANMPSILAEISFVSNPGDEKRLQTPEHRQKIADSLFKGVSRYADGLSGIKVASTSSDSAAQ